MKPPPLTPPGAEEGRCGSCGKRILWVVNMHTGKSVPLDPAPPVYVLRWMPPARAGEQPTPFWGRALAASPAFTSHFSTCANPVPFSGLNRPRRTT